MAEREDLQEKGEFKRKVGNASAYFIFKNQNLLLLMLLRIVKDNLPLTSEIRKENLIQECSKKVKTIVVGERDCT